MILTDLGKEFDNYGGICHKTGEEKVFPGVGFCMSFKTVFEIETIALIFTLLDNTTTTNQKSITLNETVF